MFAFKKILFITSLWLVAGSTFGAHFVKIIKPGLVRTIGKDESLFMSKFSGRNYENHDKTKLLMACSNGTFEIADKVVPANSKTCQAQYGVGVKYVNFSPSGNRIVSTSQKGTVKVWDLNCNLLAELDDPSDSIHLATFGDNDDEIFTNSMKAINRIWTLIVDDSKL